MNFEFTEIGWEDYQYWIENDNSLGTKSNNLLRKAGKPHFRVLENPNRSGMI